jgi:hypothetical protein
MIEIQIAVLPLGHLSPQGKGNGKLPGTTVWRVFWVPPDAVRAGVRRIRDRGADNGDEARLRADVPALVRAVSQHALAAALAHVVRAGLMG